MPVTKSNKVLPRRGALYTLQQILKHLALEDSPVLGFIHKNVLCSIATSHVTSEELLSIPGAAQSNWKYLYTTNDYIPVFDFVGADIEKFVNIEQEYNPDGSYSKSFWVTPKGFPRRQYYAPKGVRSKNNNMFVYNSYWGTWSRILQEGTPQNNFECIEVDVTPVNPHRAESWERQIPKVNIRKHVTERSKRDKFVGTLPEEVVTDLNKYIVPEIQHFILHEDLLPQIDWELYRKHNNGGASFDLIRKSL